jgi:hypothetical protein
MQGSRQIKNLGKNLDEQKRTLGKNAPAKELENER